VRRRRSVPAGRMIACRRLRGLSAGLRHEPARLPVLGKVRSGTCGANVPRVAKATPGTRSAQFSWRCGLSVTSTVTTVERYVAPTGRFALSALEWTTTSRSPMYWPAAESKRISCRR
jgi:hypothetical protein